MQLIVDFPTKTPMRGGVTFADESEMKFVENLSNTYKDELWFSHFEMQLFRRELAWLIKTISSSNITMAQFAEMNVRDTSAFLGLEAYLTKSSSRGVVERRRTIADAVLAEQRRQLAFGVSDPKFCRRLLSFSLF